MDFEKREWYTEGLTIWSSAADPGFTAFCPTQISTHQIKMQLGFYLTLVKF